MVAEQHFWQKSILKSHKVIDFATA